MESEIRKSLINSIISYFRGAAQDAAQVRTGLEAKPTAELNEILANAAIEQMLTQKDGVFQAKAERDAAAVIYDLEHNQPKRDAEAKAALAQDRETFQDAAKTLRSFALNEANFHMIRGVLGTGFSVHQIDQLVQANGAILSPPSQQELDQWQREAIEAYNESLKRLADTDPLAFRNLVRQEGARMAARAQGQHQEQQIQIREVKDAGQFPPLPTHNQWGEALDSLYFRKLSNNNYDQFKQFVKKHGAAQINERLRQGIKDIN